MKIDINKLDFKKISDNIYQINHDKDILKIWSPKIQVPFGIDKDYDKYLIRLEINEDESVNKNSASHIYFKKVISHIEKLIKKKLNVQDNEFKSVIRKRGDNKCDLLECRIKSFKKNIQTIIEYEDKDNNYLKTIFDIEKQCYVKVLCEIYGLWDYRNELKENNKIGLILYASKIIVLK
jgi:hypothetical protein